MDVLKLQYVHDEKSQLIHIDHAEKGQNYFCPLCKSQLFLKAGRVKAKHFSHPKDAACSTEDLKRVISTHLISQAIQSNINSVSSISLNRLCVRCDKPLTQRIQPGYISSYESNYSSEGESCDLALFVDHKPALAIQINYQSEIDPERIQSFPLRWIELDADELISDPSCWTPIMSSLNHVSCHSCHPRIKNVLSIAHQQGYDRSMYEPVPRHHSRFLADITNCPHCNKDVIYFYWQGASHPESIPPSPTPHTIRYLPLSAGGHGWTNSCSNCKSSIESKHFYPSRVRSELTIQEFINHQLSHNDR